MLRPMVVLAGALYHPAGETLLRRHFEVRELASPSAAELAAAAACAHAIAARYPNRVDAAVLAAAPRLVVVACSGRGTDAVDIEAATRHGVLVVNNPGFGQRPVSEAAIAMVLALAKRLLACDAWTRRGEGWAHRGHLAGYIDVAEKTLGIIGLGQIGSETARKAIAAFGMKVLAYDPYVPTAKAEALGATRVDSLERLLEASDFVSLHPELTAETRGMIGEAALRRMKRSAYLVNTARGRLVQEAALVRALKEGWIAGAALDVYEDEPLGPQSALYGLDNLLLTPHVAGLSVEALEGMSHSTAEQIRQALSGERPPHLVNPQAWDAARAKAPLS